MRRLLSVHRTSKHACCCLSGRWLPVEVENFTIRLGIGLRCSSSSTSTSTSSLPTGSNSARFLARPIGPAGWQARSARQVQPALFACWPRRLAAGGASPLSAPGPLCLAKCELPAVCINVRQNQNLSNAGWKETAAGSAGLPGKQANWSRQSWLQNRRPNKKQATRPKKKSARREAANLILHLIMVAPLAADCQLLAPRRPAGSLLLSPPFASVHIALGIVGRFCWLGARSRLASQPSEPKPTR